MQSAKITVTETDQFNALPRDNDVSVSGKCEVYPKERDALLDAIDYLETLNEDWDGHGAAAANRLATASARRFIKELPFDLQFPEKVRLDGEGNVVFLWKQKANVIVTTESALLHLSKKRNNGYAFKNDVVFDHDLPMPTAILRDFLPKRSDRA